MNHNLTELACVIDRSGSMDSIKTDAIGGFNAFLQAQKQEPGEARLTLILFNHEYNVVHNGRDIQAVPPLDEKSYVPSGTTALLDAVGRTIDDVGVRLANTPEAERPGKVIVAILTDGLENASKDYSRDRIAEMIQHQQTKYSWEFVFLAANQDAIATASSLSIQAKDAYNFAPSPAGVRAAYEQMSADVSRRRKQK